MLPDFPRAKAKARKDVLRHVDKRVPIDSPLLKGIARFRQHEGAKCHLHRIDDSRSEIEYQHVSFEFEMSREEMRTFNADSVRRKLQDLSKRMGEAQTKRMLEMAHDAADAVGNIVDAQGAEFSRDHLLEIFRIVQMDFDPRTLQPTPGWSFVLHPDTYAKLMPKLKEWEQDPSFEEEYQRILNRKREEWRDREARRKLVD